jgi:hypothetical protein
MRRSRMEGEIFGKVGERDKEVKKRQKGMGEGGGRPEERRLASKSKKEKEGKILRRKGRQGRPV